MKLGSTYFITGSLQPKTAGSTVTLLINGLPDPINTTTSDSSGNFKFSYTPSAKGVIKIAISSGADATFGQSMTDSLSVLIR